ncbi:MAG: endonuclease III domain-containing protein [Salinispira sp.]
MYTVIDMSGHTQGALPEPSERIIIAHELLKKEYDEYTTLLEYRNAWELLIAVSLSAQTTDAQVNKVVGPLFARWPEPGDLADAPLSEIEDRIHGTGFYRNKARNVRAAGRVIRDNFNGVVPNTIDELVTVPGIGRKSAGVILHHIFNKPAIIVDTHFGRVCSRLGLLRCDPAEKKPDPLRTEQRIAELMEPSRWGSFSMVANLHGRRYCMSRNPNCAPCPLREICAYKRLYYERQNAPASEHR